MEAEENHTSKKSKVEGSTDGGGGLRPWNHPASRIYRVSRASGGKDRHSKVYTAKGLRDRRVRLSVSTAIQFYDLQDRLGYDQPSKAIEWLIKAAAAPIAELPTLESSFPEVPKEEKLELELDPGGGGEQNQHLSLTKSGCSSTSETSKGSVLSLSRSESRVKARERARERAAKDQDGGANHQTVSTGLNSQSSFTELLTGGGRGGSNGVAVTAPQMESGMHKQNRYLPVTTTADYFAQAGLFSQPQKSHHHQSSPTSGFTAQAHLGNSSFPMTMMPFNIAAADAAAAAAATDHSEMQQFSFLQDHPAPLAVAAAADYNLNFSISSGLAGFNRGTLQSNSPSQIPHHHHHHHHQLQRLSSPVDGSNIPFFFGTASPAAASTENQFPAGFDARLQLCYGDGYRHSDLKGKGKS